jgi:serine/threonine-protein kinase
LLALEADIARAVATSLGAPLTSGDSARLNHSPQMNPAAEDAYFHGKQQLERYGRDRAGRALEAFDRATRLDPQHARAYAATAMAYFSLGDNNAISHPEARASAVAAIQRALAIDENLPDARAVLGDIKFYYDWDWAGAEAEYKRALDVNPSFTYARKRYAGLLAAARRLDEAVEESTKAVSLDPLSMEAAVQHGMVLYYRGDYDAARDVLNRALERERDWGSAWALLSRINEAEGRFDEALDAIAKVHQSAGDANIGTSIEMIRLEALAGRPDQARRHLEALQQSVARSNQRIPAQQIAYAELTFGNPERALDRLEEAINQREPGLLWLAVDPRVEALRPLPRFNALLARLHVPEVRKK